MSEETESKLNKKPIINIKDIEKSIDAILLDRTQKNKPTTTPKQTPRRPFEIKPVPGQQRNQKPENIPTPKPHTKIKQKRTIQPKTIIEPFNKKTHTITTLEKQLQSPLNVENPHPPDIRTHLGFDTTSFTPNIHDRPSVYAVKKKPSFISKKTTIRLPPLSTLLHRKQASEKILIPKIKEPSTLSASKPLNETTTKDSSPTTLAYSEPMKKTLKPKKQPKIKKTSFVTSLSNTKIKKKHFNKAKITTPRPQQTYQKTTTSQTEPLGSIQQLSSDESNWVDQKIQETRQKAITQNTQSQLQLKNSKFSRQQLLKKLKQPSKNTPPTISNYLDRADYNIQPNLQNIPHKDKKKSFSNLFQKNRTPKSTIRFTFQGKQQKTSKELFTKLQGNQEPKDHILKTSPELTLQDTKPQDAKIQDINQLKTILLEDLGYEKGGCEELDFYPLEEPFAYVEIIREKKTLDKRYVLIEIDLTNNEREILNFIRESLNNINVDAKELEEKGDRDYLREQVERIIEDYMIKLDDVAIRKIIYYIEKQFLGLEKLEVLMRDPNIEDISCDGSCVPIFLYHRRYGSLRSNVKFETEDELASFVIKLAQKCGKHISIAEPMLDATMPNGSRIQMTLSNEITTKGSTFTIRKFMEDPFSPPDLIEFNSMSSEMVAYMWMAIENGINALIAGGTAAGKTSALNALALFIPQESKIVSIEETREINLPHPNWIPGVSRSGFGEVIGNKVMGEIDLYDLMKAALRQRPEYIIVGEIRGKEAYVLFQAMATGHTTYSTVHADSAQSLIHRLEGKPINIPRIMLQTLDVVCIQIISRVKNKRARRCKQIIEIIDIDPTTKEILTNEVFHWDPIEDKFIYSGKSYVLERIRAENDLTRDQMTKELHDRANLLKWMNEQNIREFKKVATLIAQYVEEPKKIMEKIGG